MSEPVVGDPATAGIAPGTRDTPCEMCRGKKGGRGGFPSSSSSHSFSSPLTVFPFSPSFLLFFHLPPLLSFRLGGGGGGGKKKARRQPQVSKRLPRSARCKKNIV